MSKTAEAFRTISEVADSLEVPKHVLRFWESKFPQVRPMKRGGGRRYYRPEDMELLRGICHLLHAEGYTIKGVQKILREQGVDHVKRFGVAEPVKEPAGKKGAKRGRRSKSRITGMGASIPPDAIAVPGGRSYRGSAASAGRANILAAIAELENCRNLLLDRPVQATARRKGQKQRRAARSS